MKLCLVGDIAFFGQYCLEHNLQLKDNLKELKSIFDDCDLIVGNLETPFSSDPKFHGSKSAYIHAQPLNVAILKYLGVNAVSLSNNHIYDFGSPAITETKNILEQNNIDWFGVDGRSFYTETCGEKFAFHGFCSFNTNPSYLKKGDIFGASGLNFLKHSDVLSMLKSDKDSERLSVLSIHSGLENLTVPSLEDINFAKKLAANYNYIYHGHHPHVLQGVEKEKDSLLAYSLGNFCFDDIYDYRTKEILVSQSQRNKTSALLIIEVENSRISSYDIIPFSFDNGNFEINSKYALSIVKEVNNNLDMSHDEICKLRDSELSEVVKKRKKTRNLKWFISRFRISTITRLANNYYNKKMHVRYFSKFI
ncbi:CapA family protein [Enterovibrio norvegicus]|uniref:CapA family protein n=1 Tax=Enterovibrio norvegicus TaxID=188144 RepID=UPI0013D09E0E|nr:CapA family protein [Enterovibrio norvegicus]